jgi:uncharacterized membrane protein
MWVPGRDPVKPAVRPPAHAPVLTAPSAIEPGASTSGQFKDNLTAAFAYVTFIPAVVFVLVTPFKRNRFVRFHSFQSIFLAVATVVAAVAMRILYSILTLIPAIGYLLAWLTSAVVLLGWVILWLVLLVKALQGETFRLPVIGSLAERA